ncbi:MAG: hypothetical protein IPK69_11825 [Phycisphaerales bacterium]|nr:MAG: hypothetical protein IPK69_11825 [Phycisphaerales bacterium]
MTWPTTPGYSTGNVDNGSDSPSAARADLLNAFNDLTNVISGRNQANGVCPLGSDSKVPAVNLPVIPIATGMIAWQTAGLQTWTVPANVTKIIVEAWGAGGGGGFSASPNPHGGGGGAGGGAVKVWSVTPGSTVNISVGAGGAGGIGPANANGAAGGNTTVTIGATTITGVGGLGGVGGATPFGGSGGNATGGDVNLAGGTSMTGIAGMGGIGGSNARSGAAPGPVGSGFGGGGYGSGTTGPPVGIAGKDGGVLIIW